MTNRTARKDMPVARRSPGRPTASESQALYKSIVAAATDEFVSLGFERANVSDIAATARSTKATIYRLFGSKEQLFQIAIREALKNARPTTCDFDGRRDPYAVLMDAAIAISTSYLTGSVGPLWHAVLAVKKRFPEFHDEILQVLRQESIASSLASYLGALHERGILHVPDPLLTAHHFSLLVGQGRELALPPKATAAQESDRIEQIVSMFIRGHRPAGDIGQSAPT